MYSVRTVHTTAKECDLNQSQSKRKLLSCAVVAASACFKTTWLVALDEVVDGKRPCSDASALIATDRCLNNSAHKATNCTMEINEEHVGQQSMTVYDSTGESVFHKQPVGAHHAHTSPSNMLCCYVKCLSFRNYFSRNMWPFQCICMSLYQVDTKTFLSYESFSFISSTHTNQIFLEAKRICVGQPWINEWLVPASLHNRFG